MKEVGQHIPSSLRHRSFLLQHALGYLFSLLLVGLALVVFELEHILLSSFYFPSAPFFLSVLLVAFVWGLGPALVSVCLSMLALDYFYLPSPLGLPFNVNTWRGLGSLLLFAVVALLTVMITVRYKQEHRRALTAEREQRKRVNELEAMFEAITDGVAICDEQGIIRRANQAARQLFSFAERATLAEQAEVLATRDEQGTRLPIDRLPLSRVLHGEVLTGTSAVDVQMMAAQGWAQGGAQGGAQGQRLNVSVTGAPIYTTEGSLSGAIIVLRDVTMRRQQELRTQKGLSTLLSMAEILVQRERVSTESQASSVEETQQILFLLAERAHRTLRCTHTSLTAINGNGVLQPALYIGFTAEEEQTVRGIADRLKAMKVYEPMVPILRKDGAIILDTTTAPLNIWQEVGIHRPLVVLVAFQQQFFGSLSLDFGATDHEYSDDEIALAKAMGRLIALVIEHDRLERQRLEARANEVSLREANRRMDQFLGIASHELRTPLTAMKGYIELADMRLTRFLFQMSSKDKNDEFVDIFDILQMLFRRADAQADLLIRLVNDLVDVSRIHADKLRMNQAVYDLANIVSNAVQEQRQMAVSRTISLQLPDAALHVFADADRIGQVVTNYLTNALKYSASTTAVAVCLSLDGKAARVEVSDEGPGLSSEQISHLWERFYQVPGIVVQSGSSIGLGIGLYICHTIISDHGGEVGVQRNPRQGSTFWFTLPVVGEAYKGNGEVELPRN